MIAAQHHKTVQRCSVHLQQAITMLSACYEYAVYSWLCTVACTVLQSCFCSVLVALLYQGNIKLLLATDHFTATRSKCTAAFHDIVLQLLFTTQSRWTNHAGRMTQLHC
jgi:hypothetical protein